MEQIQNHSVIRHFLHYVSFPTMSDENAVEQPSTRKQFALANTLRDELISLGLEQVSVSDTCYVYATLPSNVNREVPTLGFIAHMDTALESPDSPIRPRIVEYTGQDIVLDPKENLVLSETQYEKLAQYRGKHLIVTDGHTLLGGDDKAGIAAIMVMLEKLIQEKIPHGRIEIAFTPDEEIGRGTENFDLNRFRADYAYTVDGGEVGELSFENFNAASAVATFHGIAIHPGSAKGKMKNAALLAAEFADSFPPSETPACTEGYEGFYHLMHLEGVVDLAKAAYIIRDHDFDSFAARKAYFRQKCDEFNLKYGEGTVECEIKDSYYNMRSYLEKDMRSVERAKAAMQKVGIEPLIIAIRGGTDGAMLTYKGLNCPNLGTGDNNAHSCFEYVVCEDMIVNCDILCEIAKC